MKTTLIIIAILLVVIVSGYFLFREKGGTEPTHTPSPTDTASVSPEPSPTSSLIPAGAEKIKATIYTARGNIELELYPKIAPKTVTNFVKLAQEKFYDGTKFHRVVDDFVIQGGDPLSKTLPAGDPRIGTGGPGYSFEDEINPKAQGLDDASIAELIALGYQYSSTLQSLPVKVGVIAMANSGPNTNGSQFFIVTTKDQPFLNGKHTVFGKVTKGMDVVNKIKQGDEIQKIVISKK